MTVDPCNTTDKCFQSNIAQAVFSGLLPEINYTFILRANNCMGSIEECIEYGLILHSKTCMKAIISF